MKKTLGMLIGISFLIGCTSPKKVLIDQGAENWSEFHAGNAGTIQNEWKVYTHGNDTLIHFTNYYTNGKLKSKVVMKNDELWQIEAVFDSLGNKKNFGTFKDGNGCVIQFTDDTGSPKHEGCYINGNKEGWWKTYHYSGSVLDSTFYKDGYPQFPEATNDLEKLLELFGPMKNNFYD